MYRILKIGILAATLSAAIGFTSNIYAKTTQSSNSRSKQIAELCSDESNIATHLKNEPFRPRKGAFNRIPRAYKWISDSKAIFSYTGSYTDKDAFAVDVTKSRSASRWKVETGVKAPEKGFEFNEEIEKMYAKLTEIANKNPEKKKTHNTTYPYYSPDSTKIAITFLNDLYVYDVREDKLTKLTFDGSDMVMNGYASWVYFEEIFGRPTKYKAFWWSPDSKKIAYYQFDNSPVPMFPIYSPFGQDGKLINTRYPKAGRDNPYVKVGIVDLAKPMSNDNAEENSTKDFTVWADFDYAKDGYFGTPFWGKDSEELFVSREPRIQNTLDLYSISIENGAKKHIYHEEYKPAWLDWIDGMLFTDEGLYMVRSFETGWEQIYFLSYDGKTLKRLTDGKNWRTSLERVDADGRVYFIAERDSDVRKALYAVDKKGNIQALTDPEYNVANVQFSPNGKNFIASLSNYKTPTSIWMAETARLIKKNNMISVNGLVSASKATESQRGVPHKELFCTVGESEAKSAANIKTRDIFEVANLKGENYNENDFALPNLIYITTKDGLTLPATITYPVNFDPEKKYPVHVDLYGGPDTPLVRESWRTPSEYNQWWSQNGIIQAVIDCRAAGHNGHLGMDQVYKHLNTIELEDFKDWARYFQSLPYVRNDKIGVEGFSFGGTMTSMLVFTAPELFHYGIAGGGVYDWALYDTHYTERFMETPQTNADGYKGSKVLNYVKDYIVNQKPGYSVGEAVEIEPVMLKITHGTADDNVHFQQTLQLIDELHKQGKEFEFMIYPDGKHGYHGYQGSHFLKENRKFWLKYLCK